MFIILYFSRMQLLFGTCLLMLSLLHGKQNLWWLTDGHCTKCVSSSRSWHSVHFSVGFGGVGLPLLELLAPVPLLGLPPFGPLDGPPPPPFCGPLPAELLPGLATSAADGDWLIGGPLLDPLAPIPLGPPALEFVVEFPPMLTGPATLVASPSGFVLFGVPLFACWATSVDVTVVLDTCREPDDLRPLEEPAKMRSG